jgi:hypothetical protein
MSEDEEANMMIEDECRRSSESLKKQRYQFTTTTTETV